VNTPNLEPELAKSSRQIKPLSSGGGGWLAWMVGHRVAPNLLMLLLIAGGIYMSTNIKKEVFPEFESEIINVRVVYPGSSPEEIERGIVLAIEEEIRGVDGIKEVNSTASEGSGQVSAEVLNGFDVQKVYQDIQQAVARIDTFPDDSEEPRISIASRRSDVLDISLYGPASESALREVAELVRDRLLQEPQISVVELNGIRDHEVLIEVPEQTLRAHGLTLQTIADRIRQTALELPAGQVRSDGGDILLRFKERKDWADEYAKIPIVTTSQGAVLRLEDIAHVHDGFEDTDRSAIFNGQPSIVVEIYRVGDQAPVQVVEAAKRAMNDAAGDLPEGIGFAMVNDDSLAYKQRLELLLRNGFIGLVLVMVMLSLFLEFKLAFWVVIGIPTSFLGAILFLPWFGVSINMISMFAFIISLGIVVDDAIVAGENIYEWRQRGVSAAEAAARGAKQVLVPISFAILTNIAAFFPLMFVPGFTGKIWAVIPVVVTSVFAISWIESLVILPAHLAHAKKSESNPINRALHNAQQRFSALFVRGIQTIYGPILTLTMKVRYLTIAGCTTLLILVISYAASGRMGFEFLPRTEGDRVDVTVMMPVGSPTHALLGVQQRLQTSADQLLAENDGEQLSQGVTIRINGNQVRGTIYLHPADERSLGSSQLRDLWRQTLGPMPEADSTLFQSDRGGPGSGRGLSIELSHRDIGTLNRAAATLAGQLEDFPQTSDIDNGFQPGKDQLDFTLTERGRSLGLTTQSVARQLRAAFLGIEAIKQQRGRNELTVRVRRPESERRSGYDIETLLIQTPMGTQVPLREIANVREGKAFTSIQRRDGRRSVVVSCNVTDPKALTAIQTTVEDQLLPALNRDFPGLSAGYQGRQRDRAESMVALRNNFLVSLIVIYALLAIPFRSYLQPAIVMMAIPFGVVGAILGHLIMGFSLSVISMMGIIALSGVVINDSLVMIDFANQKRREGATAWDAVHAAGVRRFRPIFLTTITTFGGLAPMIFEESRQARFLIPMAISLGFGILFATAILLVLIPSLYLAVEDLLKLGRTIKLFIWPAHIDQKQL